MSRYVAGYSMPGCLPEAQPVEFDTFSEAVAFLVGEVELFWDQDAQSLDGFTGGVQGNDSPSADERWLSVHTALHNVGAAAEFSEQTGDGSLVLWITQAEGSAD